MASQKKIRVGVLGATGTVGQRFVQLLENHPQFELAALASSERTQGKTYAEACVWRLPGEMPAQARSLRLAAPEPSLDCDIVFSSLPASLARLREEAFAHAGYPVISNSSACRMDSDVPLVVPEVNPEHLLLLAKQRVARSYGRGFILANPNCSAVMISLALAPLDQRFGVKAAVVTTLQALSGAGYPGVASLDISDNVLPFIDSEEEKIERETRKILGRMGSDGVAAAPFCVSAQCHRVNVSEGHMAAVRVQLAQTAGIEEVAECLRGFTSLPQTLRLPSAPERPLLLRSEPDRPQPRLDRDAGRGMSVTIGRLAKDRVLDYRFVALSHNTIRGAAGAALLNAELALAQGYL